MLVDPLSSKEIAEHEQELSRTFQKILISKVQRDSLTFCLSHSSETRDFWGKLSPSGTHQLQHFIQNCDIRIAASSWKRIFKIQNFEKILKFPKFLLRMRCGVKSKNGLIQFSWQRMPTDSTSSVYLRAQQLRSGLDCSCKLTSLKAGTKFTVSLRPNNQIHKSDTNNLPRQIYERLSSCSTFFFCLSWINPFQQNKQYFGYFNKRTIYSSIRRKQFCGLLMATVTSKKWDILSFEKLLF